MEQRFEVSRNEPAETFRKTYPAEGSSLKKQLSDAAYRENLHSQLKKYNPLMATFYKIGLLPLFGVSKTVMLLTTMGRKTGKLRSTPIGYFKVGGQVYLPSAWGKNTNWYKNIMAAPDKVWIQIGMKKKAVTIHEVIEPAEVQSLLERLVKESPANAKMIFGWNPGVDRLENADFTEVIEEVIFIRFDVK